MLQLLFVLFGILLIFLLTVDIVTASRQYYASYIIFQFNEFVQNFMLYNMGIIVFDLCWRPKHYNERTLWQLTHNCSILQPYISNSRTKTKGFDFQYLHINCGYWTFFFFCKQVYLLRFLNLQIISINIFNLSFLVRILFENFAANTLL